MLGWTCIRAGDHVRKRSKTTRLVHFGQDCSPRFALRICLAAQCHFVTGAHFSSFYFFFPYSSASFALLLLGDFGFLCQFLIALSRFSFVVAHGRCFQTLDLLFSRNLFNSWWGSGPHFHYWLSMKILISSACSSSSSCLQICYPSNWEFQECLFLRCLSFFPLNNHLRSLPHST